METLLLNILKQTRENISSRLTKDIILSFNNYNEQNNIDDEITSIDELFDSITSNEIYVVLKNYKFIGIFFHTFDDINKEISFKIFIHPRACPKSNVSLIKCATTNTFIKFLDNRPAYDKFEFATNHPILASTVKMFLPSLEVTNVLSEMIICFKKISDKDYSYFSNFIRSYTVSNTQNYDDYELTR